MATPTMKVWICWGLRATELSPTGSSQLIPNHVTQSSQLGGDGKKSFSPWKQSSSWDVALTRVVITAFLLPTVPEFMKTGADVSVQSQGFASSNDANAVPLPISQAGCSGPSENEHSQHQTSAHEGKEASGYFRRFSAAPHRF